MLLISKESFRELNLFRYVKLPCIIKYLILDWQQLIDV